MKKINYYETYEEDFVQSKDQNYKLPDDYQWIHHSILYKIGSKILYGIAYVISYFYCKFFLHVKIENKQLLKKYKKQGYFLYANHTQPVGDAFSPAHMVAGKRIYVIASSSNLKVKIIGKFLPILGILPIPDSKHKMKEFLKAVKQRIEEKQCIVIYPEAHVWPYYTKIRPFSSTSFKFPVEMNSPSFCATTTYHKRKWGKKPGITIYIDGPFIPDQNLSKKEKQEELSTKIYQCIKNRSKKSDYEYITYKKKQEESLESRMEKKKP